MQRKTGKWRGTTYTGNSAILHMVTLLQNGAIVQALKTPKKGNMAKVRIITNAKGVILATFTPSNNTLVCSPVLYK